MRHCVLSVLFGARGEPAASVFVGVLQNEAATALPAEQNPLLIDDRRSRAASRHRSQQGEE
ncbi:hypothetical protein ACGLFO_09090 [Corynebacterium hesseae]|uniref:hypothetical protein n=1 Tax=Corynebacterium hesseae TaxID=2913502 RepID=UPI00373F1364